MKQVVSKQITKSYFSLSFNDRPDHPGSKSLDDPSRTVAINNLAGHFILYEKIRKFSVQAGFFSSKFLGVNLKFQFPVDINTINIRDFNEPLSKIGRAHV